MVTAFIAAGTVPGEGLRLIAGLMGAVMGLAARAAIGGLGSG
jgi:hypothetical protein